LVAVELACVSGWTNGRTTTYGRSVTTAAWMNRLTIHRRTDGQMDNNDQHADGRTDRQTDGCVYVYIFIHTLEEKS